MHEQRMNDVLEERVVQALERVPEVRIPVGFAARVAGQVPERRAFAVRPARYGLMTMRISMAVLVLALVVVAMLTTERRIYGVALEWVLCAELVALALWLGGVRYFFVHEV
jgi:hypothetical protein